MAHDFRDIERPTRPFTFVALMIAGPASGALLGAVTNAINGLVSPTYFITILGWHGVQDVWRASIAQGMFEGCNFGFVFALIFTIATAILTGACCEAGVALKHLFGIVAGALACWVLGGTIAMGLATLSPEFYRQAFFGVPQDFNEMLGYAWVGGSIWGVQFGGFVCMILGIFFLRANWRKRGSMMI